ncbi:MAG: hypothetical protein LBU58_02880 [Clostridiales bacterium]|nr:hypothetical protein [Clostridiales bacterium]
MSDKKGGEPVVYKTEEMLKQEAIARAAEEARLEAQLPPKSPLQKKLDNYWYHYKWQTFAACAALILVVFFIRDTVFRVQPDLTLVVATSQYVTQDAADALQAALESGATDRNGDGRVSFLLDLIYLPSAIIPDPAGGGGAAEPSAEGAAGAAGAVSQTDEAAAGAAGAVSQADEAAAAQAGFASQSVDPEMEQASVMKLMAITSAAADPLYLVDDALYAYFAQMADPTEYDMEGNPVPASSADGGAGAEGAQNGPFSIFDPLSGIAPATGPLLDRLRLADTELADAPGCETLGDLTFALRPAANAKEKTVAYHAYCAELLKTLVGS